MKPKSVTLSIAFLTALVSAADLSAGVQVGSATIESSIRNVNFSPYTVKSSSNLFPRDHVVRTSGVSGGDAVTRAIWSQTGDATTLRHEFGHLMPNFSGATYRSSNVEILLRLTEAMNYSISGEYGYVSNHGPTISEVIFDVRLQPGAFQSGVTNPPFITSGNVFWDQSRSISTANERFTVGVAGDGDRSNIFVGSSSGVLQPGYYLFKIEAKLDWNQPLPFGAAEADGFVDLQLSSFANQAAVPEPNSFAILGLGALGMVGLRRRTKDPV